MKPKDKNSNGPKTPWKDPDHTSPDEKVHDPRSTEPIPKPQKPAAHPQKNIDQQPKTPAKK